MNEDFETVLADQLRQLDKSIQLDSVELTSQISKKRKQLCSRRVRNRQIVALCGLLIFGLAGVTLPFLASPMGGLSG